MCYGPAVDCRDLQFLLRTGGHRVKLRIILFGVAAAMLMRVGAASSPQLKSAEALITPENLLRHIKELSSDAYAGRAPGTEGEGKTVAYLIAQCKEIGLDPGNPNGGWTQTVPLWGMLSQGTLQVRAGGKEVALAAGKDYVAWSALPEERVDVPHTALAFVGYGVVAPEYGWDDYAGADVRGKTVVMMSGDPPVADAKDPSKLDEKMFLGRALTVYGRTGTKLETAYKHGAAAVISALLDATGGCEPVPELQPRKHDSARAR